MKKNIFFILLACATFSQIKSQPLYNRAWGIVKAPYMPSIAEVNPLTGDLYFYVKYGSANEIHRVNRSNAASSLIYAFPSTKSEGAMFNSFKFDNNGNLIIIGRVLKPGLATSGAYSSQMIPEPYGSSGFIMKIRASGQLVWFTYFYGLSQNKEQLAIDNNNNIYVISKRYKDSVLSGSPFQNTGDTSSNINVQDVINKFDPNGKLLWSTFYAKDNSMITAIEAGDNGLYVYGDHFGSNTQSSYFGTKNSYQQYASGIMMWKQPSSTSNVFLSKFNFNGTRAWSTYFGNEISKSVYNDVTMNVKTLKVIGDDAYFLTKHTIVNFPAPSVATANVFLTNAPSDSDPVTLTKINGSGKREWTTYLRAGETLSTTTSGNELHLSAAIGEKHTNINLLTDSKSYQQQHNGLKDVYSYTMSLDGKSINYSSFYGFEGSDVGVSFPTVNGYYAMGKATQYAVDPTSFITPGFPSDAFFSTTNDGYAGNFIAFFTNKGLSTTNTAVQSQFKIYPNPVQETVYIQATEPLTEDTQIAVFDVAGKRVLSMQAKATDLNQLNVSSLNSGVYILQLHSPTVNQSFKFIKK